MSIDLLRKTGALRKNDHTPAAKGGVLRQGISLHDGVILGRCLFDYDLSFCVFRISIA